MIIHSRAKVTFSMKSKSKMAARSPRGIQSFQASYFPPEVPGLSKPLSNKLYVFRNSVDGNFISLGHWWFCFAVLIDKTIRRLQNLENHLVQCSMSRMGSPHYLLRLKRLLTCYTAAQLSVKIVLGYPKQWRLFWSEVTIKKRVDYTKGFYVVVVPFFLCKSICTYLPVLALC